MKLLSFVFVLLIFSNSVFAQDTIPSATSILNNAYTQANAENKNIILIFHASWCGWCRKMDAAMNDKNCKKIFQSNYVIVHLVVEESKENKALENPGADEIKKKFLGEKAGLPFWLILDKKGNLLADSYIRKEGIKNNKPGVNVGCPSTEEEITFFTNMLQKTASMSESNVKTIANRFKNNKQTIN